MNSSRNPLPCHTLIIAIIVSFFSLNPASAHEITPITASPGPGEIFQLPPEQVRLTFEEEISEEGSTLQVFDSQGKQVDLGNGGVDLNDAQHTALVVGLPALNEGAYLVKWKVTLMDGDASQGEYYFGVGDVVALPQAPGAAPEPEAPAGPPVALWAAIAASLILIAAVLIYGVRKARSRP